MSFSLAKVVVRIKVGSMLRAGVRQPPVEHLHKISVEKAEIRGGYTTGIARQHHNDPKSGSVYSPNKNVSQ
eukprot:2941911-Amphidinium_carterae.1